MAQNITIAGASYSDVPSISVPKTGSGTASFFDISDTTASAADVASGKYFYTAAGVKTEGTASGGGGSVDYFDMGWPVGELSTNLTSIPIYFFNGRTGITKITAQNLTTIASNTFRGCSSVEEIDCGASKFGNPSQSVFRDDSSLKGFAYKYTGKTTTSIAQDCFYNCSSLKYFDGNIAAISQGAVFYNCAALDMLVLRRSTAITSLNNTNSFDNTPFKADGTGGTLYVPSSLIATYQSASNWSVILARENNKIKSIESTHTDPTAPIDLTLYYADESLIPT